MKKLLNIFLAAGCLLAVSCSKDDAATENPLEIQKADLEFTAEGGMGSIRTASEGTLSATADQEWCHIAGISDGVISVKVDANPELLSRSAVISVRSGSAVRSTLVSQTGVIVDFGTSSLTAYARGQEYLIDVKSNASGVSASAEDSWCTASFEDGKVVVVPQDNLTGAVRTTNVLVTLGNVTKKIPLTQNKAVVAVDKSVLSFPKGGGEQYVIFTKDVIGGGIDQTSLPSWLTLSRINGDTLFMSAEANATTTNKPNVTIRLSGSPSLTANLTANQSGTNFNTTWMNNASSWYFTNAGSSKVYQSLLADVRSDMMSYGAQYTLYRLCFARYTTGGNTHALRSYLNASTYGAVYFKNVPIGENNVGIVFNNGGDNNGQMFFSYQDGYYYFVAWIHGVEFVLTPDSYVSPTKVTFTEKEDPDNWFTLTSTNTAPF